MDREYASYIDRLYDTCIDLYKERMMSAARFKLVVESTFDIIELIKEEMIESVHTCDDSSDKCSCVVDKRVFADIMYDVLYSDDMRSIYSLDCISFTCIILPSFDKEKMSLNSSTNLGNKMRSTQIYEVLLADIEFICNSVMVNMQTGDIYKVEDYRYILENTKLTKECLTSVYSGVFGSSRRAYRDGRLV